MKTRNGDNMLLYRSYEVNKILCSTGFGHKKIHTCSNDCVL